MHSGASSSSEVVGHQQRHVTWSSAAVRRQLRGGREEVVRALNAAIRRFNLRLQNKTRSLVYIDVRHIDVRHLGVMHVETC